MKIVSVKNVDDCLEASNVRDFYFNTKISKKFIDYLSVLGKFIYADEFEKPYFKVIVKGKYTIKGALGNKIIRMLLPEQNGDKYVDELISYINDYK